MFDREALFRLWGISVGITLLTYVPFRFFFCGYLSEKYGYRWCDIKGYIKAIKEKRK